jgi:hypothetical protein
VAEFEGFFFAGFPDVLCVFARPAGISVMSRSDIDPAQRRRDAKKNRREERATNKRAELTTTTFLTAVLT